MLHYVQNILSKESFTIESHDFIFKLQSDTPGCNYFGLITLANKVVKTLQFVEFPNFYKARLHLTEDDLLYLQSATFKLLIVSSSFTKESNQIPLVFDINKIKLNIKQEVSKDLIEIQKQISNIKDRVEALALGKVIPNINIVNKDYIKPGMVLIAIDEGNFMAAYPFADVITKINGEQAVDGVVEITASMIKYNTERTIVEQFKVIAEAIQAENNALKTLTEQVNSISKRVADLNIKLATHLDSGIV